jgi:hypothetical protein
VGNSECGVRNAEFLFSREAKLSAVLPDGRGRHTEQVIKRTIRGRFEDFLSFPGSARERAGIEALPRITGHGAMQGKILTAGGACHALRPQAEPGNENLSCAK